MTGDKKEKVLKAEPAKAKINASDKKIMIIIACVIAGLIISTQVIFFAGKKYFNRF